MNEIKKYVKKPIVIEAVKFTGFNFDEIEVFVGGDAENRGSNLIVATLEGPLVASPGDWIIKGVRGEFYPCKPDVFEKTYCPHSTEKSGVEKALEEKAEREEELFNALKTVEYSNRYNGIPCCFVCDEFEPQHKPDCIIGNALGKKEEF